MGISFKRKLWEHQLTAIKRGAVGTGFGLWHEVGTGKTTTAINIIRYWWAEDRVRDTLILCPPIVIEAWVREWAANSNLDKKRIVALTASGKQRATAVANALQPSVFITNYETLLMPQVFEKLRDRMAGGYLVCDESQRIKNPSSKRTKASIKLADTAHRRIVMSGTPVLNTPMDLWAQYRVLDRGATFGTNFFAFRAEYFHDKNAGMPPQRHFPDWRIRPGKDKVFAQKIQASSDVVKKSDCLDLPPLVRVPIEVGLSAEQSKAYEQMKRDFIAFMAQGVCTTQIALTKAMRLQQIASGFIPVEGQDGEVQVAFEATPRIKALGELLADLAPSHKVIVWATWRQNYAAIEALCRELGISTVAIHGGVSPKDKQLAVDRFQTGDAQVLIGHPGAGGVGITLTASDVSIFFSRGFSLEHDIQAEARNYRAGSERHRSVTRYDIVATGTIDELVHEALAAKQEIGEKIIRRITA